MENRYRKYIEYADVIVMLFIFLIYFALPVFFTRIGNEISWRHVFKIWLDQILLIPIFLINHWVFVPRLLFRKKYFFYLVSTVCLIILFSASYWYFDKSFYNPQKQKKADGKQQPAAIPPFANLLMSSLLVVGVDSGLLFLKKWNENEYKKNLLEKQNTQMQLEILRNQISPHFFMNTLNNIYALIDCDTLKAKEVVMKLSKLMRYMLYENGNGKVKLSKEFEFIQSFIDLMKIRYTEDLNILFKYPSEYQDIEIPPMLFISFVENAFKYGASYQENSFIYVIFELNKNNLRFTCINSINKQNTVAGDGGLGLENSKNRLKLIFSQNYKLEVKSSSDIFTINLEIPLI